MEKKILNMKKFKQIDNFDIIDYFNSVFKTDFSILHYSLSFNNEKKILRLLDPNNMTCESNVSYAIKLETKFACFLDIDYVKKTEQFNRFNITDYSSIVDILSKYKVFYAEKTFNNGLHICILLQEELPKSFAVTCDQIVVEFKNQCLVYPTDQYEPLVYAESESYEKFDCELINNLLKDLLKTAPFGIKNYSIENVLKTNLVSKKRTISENISISDSEDDQQPVVTKKQMSLIDMLDRHNLNDPAMLKTLKKMPENSQLLLEKLASNYKDYKFCINPTTNTVMLPEESDNVTFLDIISKDVLDNVSKHFPDKPVMFQTYFDPTMKIYTFLKKDKKASIVRSLNLVNGDILREFLEWILICKIDNESVFATLESPPVWKKWIKSYCELVVFLENCKVKMGTYSRFNIDDYKIYRTVTVKNTVGAAHSEFEEEKEYNEWKMAAQSQELFSLDVTHYFVKFVATTISSIALDNQVGLNFACFVYYFVNRTLPTVEMEYLRDRFFNIKMANLTFFCTKINNDSENGNKMATCYFCFNLCPWYSVKSDFFTKLLKFSFPNTQNIGSFINYLCNSCEYSNEIGNLELKKWSKMFPFMNGVFDFAPKDFSQAKNSKAKIISLEPKNCNEYEMSTNFETYHKINTTIFRNYNPLDGVTVSLFLLTCFICAIVIIIIVF